MTTSFKAALSVMAGAALWGFISVFVRRLTALGLSSMQIVALRGLFGCLMLGLYLLIKAPSALRIRLRHAWCFAGTGLFSFAFFNWCYFTTIRESQASIAVVLLYTSPIFVMLLAAAVFREKITGFGLAAVAATFLGCVLVAGPAGGVSLRVLLTGLGSGFGYALYSIFGRFALRHYGSLTVTFYTMFFGLWAVVPLAQPAQTAALVLGAPEILFCVCGIALFCTVLPYILYTWGLAYMPAGRAAVLATIEPVAGALLGWLAYGEPMGLAKLAGIVLILSAVLLLQRGEKATKE